MTDAQDIRDNTARRRYELDLGGQIAFLRYHDRPGGERVLAHTEVPAPHEGQGIGGRLAEAALQDARSRNRRIVPACPFVAAYIKRHPEHASLVASGT
jgi:predicted GNAT family acetyltransferase